MNKRSSWTGAEVKLRLAGERLCCWRLVFILILVGGGTFAFAGDGYPRHVVTPELRERMLSGLPEEMRRLSPVQVGDPLPPHIVHYEDQVRWLVERIGDDPVHADHLKYGFFLRRWPGQWHAAAALRLIEQRIDVEERESLLAASDDNRTAFIYTPSEAWLRLSAVAAFARSRRIQGGGDLSGAYRRIWNHAASLRERPDLFRSIVADYVNAPARRNGLAMPAISPAARDIGSWLPAWLSVDAAFSKEPDLGRFFISRQSWPEAEALIEGMAEENTNSLAFHRRLGLSVYGSPEAVKTNPENAIRAVRHLEAVRNHDVFTALASDVKKETLSRLIELYATLGRWDEAIECAEWGQRHNAIPVSRIARLHHEVARKHETDAAVFEVGTEAEPVREDGQAVAQRYRDVRDRLLDQVLREKPDPKEVFAWASLLAEAGRSGDARQYLRRFLDTTNPEATPGERLAASVLLAHLLVQSGESEAALEALDAIDLSGIRPAPDTMPHLTRYFALRRILSPERAENTPRRIVAPGKEQP